METYKVMIYPHAITDLQDIVDHLNTLSPQAAIKYYDLFIEHIGRLAYMPERCPYVRDVVLKAKGYRYLLVENYLVFFAIKDGTVQIRRIIYGKRNYGWLL